RPRAEGVPDRVADAATVEVDVGLGIDGDAIQALADRHWNFSSVGVGWADVCPPYAGGPMAIRAISHVAVGVRDMDRALRFHAHGLGLRRKLSTIDAVACVRS